MQDEKWFNKSYEEICKELKVNSDNGLTDEQIKNNREKYGINELKQGKKKSIIIKFLEQFKDFMIIILIIAAIISGIVGFYEEKGITDSIIILIVVLVNASISLTQETKAEKSLEALQKLSNYSTKVIRNGKLVVIPSKDLVIGDIVILETGDYVSADLRIIEAINLKAEESSLTGESVPVEKMKNVLEDINIGIGDRVNMLFSSSLITYGRGKAIVVETGMNTEVGKIAKIINTTIKSETPLQVKLNKLGKILGIVALIICAVIFTVGLVYGKEPIDMFMIAVSLAVAAIPEGLAAVSTIVLAIGVQKMAKKNAIIKKLPAVETLGSATVICSDKTGTLTQNRMTVEKIFYNNSLTEIENIKQSSIKDELERLIYISMFCNDSKVDVNNKLSGDPTETALIDMGFYLNFKPDIFELQPRVDEVPFDSERKLMTTVHKIGDEKYIAYTKGGADELLKRCNRYVINNEIKANIDEYKLEIEKVNEKMGENALRVLGMAYKELDHLPSKQEMKEIEKELIFVGMVGMIDPPREDVKIAIKKCKNAGIKTVMITGDHKVTAMAIAKILGILENENQAVTGKDLENMTDEELFNNVKNYSVYARVSPEHKVRIVKAWQAHGEIVAMTGDGVNDAPALKTADIGCAMGVVGTDVSKEAADVILTDDNFSTIVAAVEEGRKIYNNILKVIQFLLSSNIGEIVVLFLTMLFAPIIARKFGIDISMLEPLLPIHILWVNLVTDSIPALTLAVDPPEKNIMNKKFVNSKKGIFTRGMSLRVVYQGLMIGALTLIAFLLGLVTKDIPIIEGLTEQEVRVKIAQTMAFAVLALSELVHVFNIRDNSESIFKTNILDNLKLVIAIIASALVMVAVLFIPQLQELFNIIQLSQGNIIKVIILIISPIIIVEIFKFLKINTLKSEMR